MDTWAAPIGATTCKRLSHDAPRCPAWRHLFSGWLGSVGATSRAVMMAGALTAATAAVAQVQPPQIPGSADPGRLQERFQTPPAPRAAPPDLSIETERPAPPDQAEKIRFILTELTVSGVTVYDEATLRSFWRDDVGHEVTLAEIYHIADALTARYRNDGYILSQVVVPAQRIRDGVVALRAVEGYVDHVIVEGDVDRAALIRSYADPVTRARPVRAGDLERALLLMQDLPGVTVRSVLRPSTTAPSAADLVIYLEQTPVDGFLTLDNRGSRYIGPFQLSTGARLNSVLGLQDQATVRLINTPDVFHELRAYDIGESIPLGENGMVLSALWSQAFARPGFTLYQFDVRSRADTFTLSLTQPVIRSRAENLSLVGSVGTSDTKTTLLGGASLLSLDRVRPLRLGINYDRADRFDGVSLAVFRISRGLPVLDATPADSTSLSRPGGRSEFTKLNADLSRRQTLDPAWALLVAVSGQYSFDRLLAVEEFGLGGAQFLRAYDPSELTGRDGIAGKLEAQYGGLPDFWRFVGNQLYGYYESGEVWNRDPTSLIGRVQSASDVGLGLRFSFDPAVSGSFEVAKPLTRGVATLDGHGYDPRVFFALVARF
jgi:hemolysin activation/secretion protein